MKIVTAIALIVTGYIMNDQKYHLKASTKHLTQILIDKIDLLRYGLCQWRLCMDVRRHYDAYYRRYDQFGPTRYVHRASTPEVKVDTILFATQDAAEYALKTIKRLYDRYGRVTLSDYYFACDKPCEYTDTKYGWTRVDDRFAVCEDPLYHTYYIDLPELETFD